MDLFLIYKFTFLAAVLSAAALGLIGAQLAARNQAMQTLVVSQGASLGVILGLAWVSSLTHPEVHDAQSIPTFIGFVVAIVMYIVCELLISSQFVSRSTYYVGLFGMLMALAYGIVTFAPGLDTHMSAAYFGDLSLATNFEALCVGALAAAALIFVLTYWREISGWSFLVEILDGGYPSAYQRRIQGIFVIISLLLIVASVQLLGLLFTTALLFLPSMMIVRRHRGMSGLRRRIVAAGAIGVGLGFTVSLYDGRIATVPAIVMATAITSLIMSWVRAKV